MAENAGTSDQQDALRELRREFEQLHERYVSLTEQMIGLRMVQEVTQELVSESDLDRLLKIILRSAIHAVEGTAGALLLLDPSGRELIFSVVEGSGSQAIEGQRMGRDQGLAGWVVSQGEPVMVADAEQDPRFYGRIPEMVGFKVQSLIGAPLIVKGEPIGVVQVLNKARGDRFGEDDLSLLTSFAAQSAIAIENTRLYQDLRRERDRLIAVEEQVRRRLARELHDGPAQLLAALLANMDFVTTLQERQPEKVPEELEALASLAEKALRQVRTLMFDLRPVVLETQGLVPALTTYVVRQQEMGDLEYHFCVSNFAGRLVASTEGPIFSIVQEAVGNVRKHAQAQNVWVSVIEQAGELTVEVRDDGRGFDVDSLNAEYDLRGSLGMLNMQDYAKAIGGRLSIRSEPGAGTDVTLVVPLSPLREAAVLD